MLDRYRVGIHGRQVLGLGQPLHEVSMPDLAPPGNFRPDGSIRSAAGVCAPAAYSHAAGRAILSTSTKRRCERSEHRPKGGTQRPDPPRCGRSQASDFAASRALSR